MSWPTEALNRLFDKHLVLPRCREGLMQDLKDLFGSRFTPNEDPVREDGSKVYVGGPSHLHARFDAFLVAGRRKFGEDLED